MDSFSQHLIFAEPYIELSAFDIDFDNSFLMPAASATDTMSLPALSSPTLSAHLSSSTPSFPHAAFVDEQEQQQPIDPSNPALEWDSAIEAQLQLLLLNADADPVTVPMSVSDVSDSLIVNPAILSLAQAGQTIDSEDATALPGSHDQPPEPGVPVLPMPLTPQNDAPPTSIALDESQQPTHTVPTGVSHFASAAPLRIPSAPALPLPLSPPGSSTAASQAGRTTHRKTRAHPYALACPQCPFVQENGRVWDLKRHVKTHEPDRKKFVCDRRGCEEIFSRMDAVRRHQKNPNAWCALAQADDA
ncbi:hypothetical protein FA95DRAFT_1573011 [Auriscalpium vulgare]|uniref:Uncharacterized protein n=1 Tax=Auriscalpium vulgare TaxID=40419 RepID=A0ACB8RS60_9AGAM|nr:hypothetical protein FA95DRAFT_1573011 [Auriscalpium vulgare]